MRSSFRLIATLALAATATTGCSSMPPASRTTMEPPQTTASQVTATSEVPSSSSVPTATASDENPVTRTPGASTSSTSTTIAATGAPDTAACDPATIADDVDRTNITVDVCAGEWAYISSPGPGDTSAFVRVSKGSWTIFDVQPGARCRSKAKADGVPDQLLKYFNTCGPDSVGSGAGAADLGLSTAISAPKCDGTGIVVLGSATNPTSYRRDVAALLKAHIGASYLITDRACPSLRQSTASGDHIYAVYRPAGQTATSICAAVKQAGGDAYGKRLDSASEPTTAIRC